MVLGIRVKVRPSSQASGRYVSKFVHVESMKSVSKSFDFRFVVGEFITILPEFDFSVNGGISVWLQDCTSVVFLLAILLYCHLFFDKLCHLYYFKGLILPTEGLFQLSSDSIGLRLYES